MRLTTLSLVVLALVAAQASAGRQADVARQLHEEQHDGRALLQKASPAPRAVAAAVARPAPSPKPAAKKAKAQSPSPKPVQSLKPNKPLPQGTLLLTAAQQQQQASQLATRALTAGNSTAYPCAVGDAPCFCKWKNAVGYFADNDPTVACKSYYWCWSINPVQGAYYTCQTGLIFDQTLSVCNWCVTSTQAYYKPCGDGYYQTWSDPWTSNPATSRLATLPPYVNLVILAFMQPDCASYPGGITFQGTGIQFSSDAQARAVVNQSIALLKKNNPNTKVVVAVGGCSSSAAGVSCATDAEFERVIRALRAALPRPALLSAAAWSIGAYGQGAWLSSQPSGDHTGMSVMSYDASNLYNVTEGYDAYRSLFPTGQILMGIEVPPEAWGGHVTSITEVNSICSYVKAHGGNGLMLWSLQKGGTPSAADISAAACTCLGLPSCGTRLAA
eukprot:scaffold9.g3179.t1